MKRLLSSIMASFVMLGLPAQADQVFFLGCEEPGPTNLMSFDTINGRYGIVAGDLHPTCNVSFSQYSDPIFNPKTRHFIYIFAPLDASEEPGQPVLRTVHIDSKAVTDIFFGKAPNSTEGVIILSPPIIIDR